MFLHAREGHVEPLGKGRDRSVRTPELLQNAASGGVRERAERGIEVALAILNHTVQYMAWCDGIQWGADTRGGEFNSKDPYSRPFSCASQLSSASCHKVGTIQCLGT